MENELSLPAEKIVVEAKAIWSAIQSQPDHLTNSLGRRQQLPRQSTQLLCITEVCSTSSIWPCERLRWAGDNVYRSLQGPALVGGTLET